MIYVYKDSLPGSVLNAVILSEMSGAKWDSIYVDPDSEISIRFKGTLSPMQVKTITMHFMDVILGDTPVDTIVNDSEYHESSNITEVFLPEGMKFPMLKLKTCLREFPK